MDHNFTAVTDCQLMERLEGGWKRLLRYQHKEARKPSSKAVPKQRHFHLVTLRAETPLSKSREYSHSRISAR
jgi:hypothetical protein